MPDKSILTLAELVQKHKHDTHHIRIKIAPEMFHVYCRIMPPQQAQNLVCELLQITRAGFDVALRDNALEALAIYKRDQTILDMRCQGFSFKSICQSVRLSRVQVWRIIQGFEAKLETIRFMETRKVRAARLKYPELDKIQALRDKLKALKPAPILGDVLENSKNEKSEKNYCLKSIIYSCDRAGTTRNNAEKMAENCGYLN